jgi:hypothetical protein
MVERKMYRKFWRESSYKAADWVINLKNGRSQWPRGLRRRSAAERLLGSWIRIPPEARTFVSCTVFVLSSTTLWDGSNTRPKESYRLWSVFESDQMKREPLYTYCEQVGRRRKDHETKLQNECKHVGMRRGWIQGRVVWQAFLLAVMKLRSLLSVVQCSFPTACGFMRCCISSSDCENRVLYCHDQKRRPMKDKIRLRMQLENCRLHVRETTN